MQLFRLSFLMLLLAAVACQKDEALPPANAVMVKFTNRTGQDIVGLSVSRAVVGDLPKGKSTADYHRYEQLGQQYGYVLVEAVGTVGGKKHFTGSACQGICGTDSAPDGAWMEPGYYQVDVLIAKDEPNALEFRLD
jgi:hypothetical protein